MFNVFKNVMIKSHQFTEEELKKFNSFMFCRWLSGTFDTLNTCSYNEQTGKYILEFTSDISSESDNTAFTADLNNPVGCQVVSTVSGDYDYGVDEDDEYADFEPYEEEGEDA